MDAKRGSSGGGSRTEEVGEMACCPLKNEIPDPDPVSELVLGGWEPGGGRRKTRDGRREMGSGRRKTENGKRTTRNVKTGSGGMDPVTPDVLGSTVADIYIYIYTLHIHNIYIYIYIYV